MLGRNSLFSSVPLHPTPLCCASMMVRTNRTMTAHEWTMRFGRFKKSSNAHSTGPTLGTPLTSLLRSSKQSHDSAHEQESTHAGAEQARWLAAWCCWERHLLGACLGKACLERDKLCRLVPGAWLAASRSSDMTPTGRGAWQGSHAVRRRSAWAQIEETRPASVRPKASHAAGAAS